MQPSGDHYSPVSLQTLISCPHTVSRVAKMPLGVYDRDLVQNIARRYEEETNTTYLIYHNATHPERPERSGLVRCVVRDIAGRREGVND